MNMPDQSPFLVDVLNDVAGSVLATLMLSNPTCATTLGSLFKELMSLTVLLVQVLLTPPPLPPVMEVVMEVAVAEAAPPQLSLWPCLPCCPWCWLLPWPLFWLKKESESPLTLLYIQDCNSKHLDFFFSTWKIAEPWGVFDIEGSMMGC